MTSAFQELIVNTTLSKKERLIADYVLNHFRDICFMTSTELAEALQISHSSVMRFTKDLGFSGYTEFQKTIREQYNAYITTHSEACTIPTVKLSQSLENCHKMALWKLSKTFFPIISIPLSCTIQMNCLSKSVKQLYALIQNILSVPGAALPYQRFFPLF